MKKVKLVFDTELWGIYEVGQTLPFHSETDYINAVCYCDDNDLQITEVDGSNLDD